MWKLERRSFPNPLRSLVQPLRSSSSSLLELIRSRTLKSSESNSDSRPIAITSTTSPLVRARKRWLSRQWTSLLRKVTGSYYRSAQGQHDCGLASGSHSICMSVFLCLCFLLCLCVFLYLSVSLYLCMCLCLSLFYCLHLSVSVYLSLSLSLSLSPYVCLSPYLYLCLCLLVSNYYITND